MLTAHWGTGQIDRQPGCDGLAKVQAESVQAGRQRVEVRPLRITDAGRRAIET
jgi:hypothetical protein